MGACLRAGTRTAALSTMASALILALTPGVAACPRGRRFMVYSAVCHA